MVQASEKETERIHYGDYSPSIEYVRYVNLSVITHSFTAHIFLSLSYSLSLTLSCPFEEPICSIYGLTQFADVSEINFGCQQQQQRQQQKQQNTSHLNDNFRSVCPEPI